MNREGATIIAADKNVDATQTTIKSLIGENQSVEIEVSSKQSVRDALDQIQTKYRTVPTIVVNAAGITRDNFILKLDEQSFDDVIRTNVKVGFRSFFMVFGH